MGVATAEAPASRKPRVLPAPIPETTWHTLVDLLPDAVVISRGGKVLFANAAAERLAAVRPGTLPGRQLANFVPPEVLAALRRVASESAGQGGIRHLVLRADGTRAAVETRFTRVTIPDGLAVLSVSRDLGPEERLERGLRRREELLDLLFASAPAGLCLVDESGVFRRVNPAYAVLVGRSPEELIGTPASVVMSPEVDGEATEALAAIATGHPVRTEVQFRRADGTDVPVALGAQSFESEAGERMTVGVAIDISARTEAERALRLSEQRHRVLLETIQEGIVMLDGELTITYANPFAATMLGTTPARLQGASVETLMGPERWQAAGPFRQALASGAAVRAEVPLGPGSPSWALITCSPLLDASGKLTGIVAALTDITDRKRQEEAHREAQEARAQARNLESLVLLAGGVAHDFNNLLVTIMANADLALMTLPQASLERVAVREARDAASRAAELAGQMLAYSGHGRAAHQPVDLPTLIRQTLDALEPELAPAIRLESRLPARTRPVMGDAEQLRQVIHELAANAAEAIDAGPGAIEVSVRQRRLGRAAAHRSFVPVPPPPGDYVEIRVRDSGPGIAPEALPRVFDPFFTTRFTGRGLGLAAVLGIVRGHGGAVRAESSPGEGSCFTVLLPAGAS
jgi:PAS domain S-box-containing protein